MLGSGKEEEDKLRRGGKESEVSKRQESKSCDLPARILFELLPLASQRTGDAQDNVSEGLARKGKS